MNRRTREQESGKARNRKTRSRGSWTVDGERGSEGAGGERFRSDPRSLFGDHGTIVRQKGEMIGKVARKSEGVNKRLEGNGLG